MHKKTEDYNTNRTTNWLNNQSVRHEMYIMT